MMDVEANRPVKIIPHETAGPYIRISMGQLESARSFLKANGVDFWVRHGAFSFNDGRYFKEIYLSKKTDAPAVQALLDSVNSGDPDPCCCVDIIGKAP
jgi:hypothetical protein